MAHGASASFVVLGVGLCASLAVPAAAAGDASSPGADRPPYVLLCRAGDAVSSYAAGKVRGVLESRGVPVRDLPLDRLDEVLRFEVEPPSGAGGGSGLPTAVVIATTARDAARSAYRALRDEPLTLGPEAFALRRTSSEKGWVTWALGGDDTGLVYAALDVARQVSRKGMSGLDERTEAPAFAFRALKFNLPWSTYREHETLSLHDQTCRDLGFWERFLDMMAENRFNRLTLWAIHPWTLMVRPQGFPEASGLSDEELRKWQSFWHSLFAMARERGIKTFMVNWNIFTSPEFSRAHGVAEYSQHLDAGYNGDGDYSELVQRYNREVVAQVLDEYPELTGIGVSQNERMKGVPEEVWQDWIVDTYFTVVEGADRDLELMVRGHTHPAPALTRAAVEDNARRLPDPVWLPLKFNWSHGHASPRLAYIHGGSSSDEWWNPPPENYKVVFTIRNEDFFVLRWGQPDFIRELLAENHQDHVGGFIIGSETYIPAKEFITRPGAHLTWSYAFEKQWLFYEMWGRLLYDPSTPESEFEDSFDERYGPGVGKTLVAAHRHASRMPLALASYRASSWDFTLYSEGFLEGAEQTWRGQNLDPTSAFLSVDEIIGSSVLDDRLCNIRDEVSRESRGEEGAACQTPPQTLADTLEGDGRAALSLVGGLDTTDPTLLHEKADVEAWSYLSLYFAEKLRGGLALERCRQSGSRESGAQAVAHLERARDHWDAVITTVDPYFDEMPLLHLGDAYITQQFEVMVDRFSWKHFRDQVDRDVDLARQCEGPPAT
jgi:hypothetical protein